MYVHALMAVMARVQQLLVHPAQVIHKQRLVAMLNQCPTMSNDRLTRIAEGTTYGDKESGKEGDIRGGNSRAIELHSRVFVSCYDVKAKLNRIWIGRVQKMGRKVEKRTIMYHRPVYLDRIPVGGFLYCHWYGRAPNMEGNKWLYTVADLNRIKMGEVKGVLKHNLKVAPLSTDKQRRKYKGPNIAPPMALSDEDYRTYTLLDAAAKKQKVLFPRK